MTRIRLAAWAKREWREMILWVDSRRRHSCDAQRERVPAAAVSMDDESLSMIHRQDAYATGKPMPREGARRRIA